MSSFKDLREVAKSLTGYKIAFLLYANQIIYLLLEKKKAKNGVLTPALPRWYISAVLPDVVDATLGQLSVGVHVRLALFQQAAHLLRSTARARLHRFISNANANSIVFH